MAESRWKSFVVEWPPQNVEIWVRFRDFERRPFKATVQFLDAIDGNAYNGYAYFADGTTGDLRFLPWWALDGWKPIT